MILLSPYLGDDAIHQRIRTAGGLARWDAPPTQAITADNFQQQLWQHLHAWSGRPGKTAQVWLGFGDHDRLRPGIDLLVPILPPDHVLVLHGGHTWNVWKPAARRLLERIAEQSQSAAAQPESGD